MEIYNRTEELYQWQKPLFIFLKSLNLTNPFKPFLEILLRTLFQIRFQIFHCYCMSNNPQTYIKASRSLSLNISIYELHSHNIDVILVILATTYSCVFNEHKISNHIVSYATQYKS